MDKKYYESKVEVYEQKGSYTVIKRKYKLTDKGKDFIHNILHSNKINFLLVKDVRIITTTVLGRTTFNFDSFDYTLLMYTINEENIRRRYSICCGE